VFLEELQTLADNFISGAISAAADLLGNQAFEIRA
jgi:hypothetical protein